MTQPDKIDLILQLILYLCIFVTLKTIALDLGHFFGVALSEKLCSKKLKSNTSRAEFSLYAEHIVAAWFLRSTKLELLNKQSQLRHFITLFFYFGENILVARKMETSDPLLEKGSL